MKLALKDIKIGGEGWYVLQQIKKSEHWTLKKVADELHLSELTLKRYLEDDDFVIKHKKHIEKLKTLGFKILDDIGQLEKLVLEVRNDINRYVEEEDTLVLNKLKESCNTCNCEQLSFFIDINIIHHNYLTGDKEQAIIDSEVLLNKVICKQYYDLIVYIGYEWASFSRRFKKICNK